MPTFDKIADILKSHKLNIPNPEIVLKPDYEKSDEYKECYNTSAEMIKGRNIHLPTMAKNALINKMLQNKDNYYLNLAKESLELLLQKNGYRIKECEVMEGWSFPIKVTLEDGYSFFIKKDNFAQNNTEYLSYVLGYKMLYGLGIGAKFDWKIEGGKKIEDTDIIFITQDLSYSKNPASNRKFTESDSFKMPKNEEDKLNLFINVLKMSDVMLVDYNKALFKALFSYDDEEGNRKNCGVVIKNNKPFSGKIFDFKISKSTALSIPESISLKKLLNSAKYNKEGDFVKKVDRQNLPDAERANFMKILEVKLQETIREYIINNINNRNHKEPNELYIEALWKEKDPTNIDDLYLQKLISYKLEVENNFKAMSSRNIDIQQTKNYLENRMVGACNILPEYKDFKLNEIVDTTLDERQMKILKSIACGGSKFKLTDAFPNSNKIRNFENSSTKKERQNLAKDIIETQSTKQEHVYRAF